MNLRAILLSTIILAHHHHHHNHHNHHGGNTINSIVVQATAAAAAAKKPSLLPSTMHHQFLFRRSSTAAKLKYEALSRAVQIIARGGSSEENDETEDEEDGQDNGRSSSAKDKRSRRRRVRKKKGFKSSSSSSLSSNDDVHEQQQEPFENEMKVQEIEEDNDNDDATTANVVNAHDQSSSPQESTNRSKRRKIKKKKKKNNTPATATATATATTTATTTTTAASSIRSTSSISTLDNNISANNDREEAESETEAAAADDDDGNNKPLPQTTRDETNNNEVLAQHATATTTTTTTKGRKRRRLSTIFGRNTAPTATAAAAAAAATASNDSKNNNRDDTTTTTTTNNYNPGIILVKEEETDAVPPAAADDELGRGGDADEDDYEGMVVLSLDHNNANLDGTEEGSAETASASASAAPTTATATAASTKTTKTATTKTRKKKRKKRRVKHGGEDGSASNQEEEENEDELIGEEEALDLGDTSIAAGERGEINTTQHDNDVHANETTGNASVVAESTEDEGNAVSSSKKKRIRKRKKSHATSAAVASAVVVGEDGDTNETLANIIMEDELMSGSVSMEIESELANDPVSMPAESNNTIETFANNADEIMPDGVFTEIESEIVIDADSMPAESNISVDILSEDFVLESSINGDIDIENNLHEGQFEATADEGADTMGPDNDDPGINMEDGNGGEEAESHSLVIGDEEDILEEHEENSNAENAHVEEDVAEEEEIGNGETVLTPTLDEWDDDEMNNTEEPELAAEEGADSVVEAIHLENDVESTNDEVLSTPEIIAVEEDKVDREDEEQQNDVDFVQGATDAVGNENFGGEGEDGTETVIEPLMSEEIELNGSEEDAPNAVEGTDSPEQRNLSIFDQGNKEEKDETLSVLGDDKVDETADAEVDPILEEEHIEEDALSLEPIEEAEESQHDSEKDEGLIHPDGSTVEESSEKMPASLSSDLLHDKHDLVMNADISTNTEDSISISWECDNSDPSSISLSCAEDDGASDDLAIKSIIDVDSTGLIEDLTSNNDEEVIEGINVSDESSLDNDMDNGDSSTGEGNLEANSNDESTQSPEETELSIVSDDPTSNFPSTTISADNLLKEEESRIDDDSKLGQMEEDCLTVSVVTWNLAESASSEKEASFIRKFRKRSGGGSDLVMIGAQECEDIKPRRAEGHRSRHLRRTGIQMLGKDYVPLAIHSLGGIQMALYCHREILGEIDMINIADVTCGVGNVFHNKGAIGVYLKMKRRCEHGATKSSRMLFVTAHLAAHVKNVDARNDDYKRIMSELEAQAPTRFLRPRRNRDGTPALRDGSHLLNSMDHVFFSGDLNYRVDLPREYAEQCINEIKNQQSRESSVSLAQDPSSPKKAPIETNSLMNKLLRRDQLLQTIAAGRAFSQFNEGKISFLPTFKFDKGTNLYDTSHKQRVPAWTDRILFKSNSAHVLNYQSVPEAMHSDHRPVYGTFKIGWGMTVPSRKVKKEKNNKN